MNTLAVRRYSRRQDYGAIWQAMQAFTAARQSDTQDEVWLLEHTPVYTLGQAGLAAHVLNPGATPIVYSDRGGQVTWHGPGQLMVYTLLDTRRLGFGPRALVDVLERVAIDLLADWHVAAFARADAPGVYVQHRSNAAKIAALGLRMRQRGCYHGMAINIDCDLAPFAGINPCGHAGMPVTRFLDVLPVLPARDELIQHLLAHLASALHYDSTYQYEDSHESAAL